MSLFILLTPLAQSLQKFSRLCEEIGTENEPELKESRMILACDFASQSNSTHMTVFSLRVPSLSKRIHREDLLASLHPLHPNVARSNLLIGFCSDLRNDPKLEDNNNDALKYAFFRLMPENRVAQRPRVSPEFQPL